jgi:hypothetical protein
MALVALDGTPLVIVGSPMREGMVSMGTLVSTTLDAANEAHIVVGQIFTEDGASHTINTTGSSSLGWRSGATTFANASTTVKVGLAAVDTATGPPARASNSTNVVNFDVSKSMVGGGGGITTTSWQEHAPDTGSKTIANGDLIAFAIQMTARAGADSVLVSAVSSHSGNQTQMPTVTEYTGGSYSAGSGLLPNVVITFSDGALGFFFGGWVASVGSTTQTWNSSSGTKEYGNFFQMPVPAKIHGLIINCTIGGNTDVILYSDPLGTPVAEKTISVDLNTVGVATANRLNIQLFASPYSSAASQPLAGILKPTSGTNIGAPYKTFNVSAHQKSETLGVNGYAINRASGAFAAQNSSKDRFGIGLLVGAFDAGGSAAGGISRARAAAGF